MARVSTASGESSTALMTSATVRYTIIISKLGARELAGGEL